MTLLVTGATGMLGQALMAEARTRGRPVLGLARSGADIPCDMTDDAALAQAFEAHRPSTVVHTAAMIDIAQCAREPLAAWTINGRAVSVLAELCRRHAVKLIHVSTEHYFTGDGTARHDEAAPVRLVNDYARQKYAAEHFALTCPGAVVARTNLVGLRGWEKPTFAEWVLKAVAEDAEFSLFEDAYGCSIDAWRCAGVLLDLSDKNAEGVFNVGSRDVFSKADFIRAVARARGRTLTRARSGSVRELSVPRAESLGLDTSKVTAAVGYPMPSLEEVARAVVDHWRKTP